MAVSVVMAACNGEKYIKEQLDSILCQLSKEDELIVSLDPSTDGIKDILLEYTKKYPQVKVLNGPGKGLIKNFENGLKHVSSEYIFLCDQDDVWKKNKVETVLSAFEDNTLLVMHDAEVVDSDLNVIQNSYYSIRKSGCGVWKNIWKNSYVGCCMAIRKELLDYILPFPNKLPMHDQYIGLVAEMNGNVKFIRDSLILYRRHSGNSSDMKHASFIQMMKWRVEIISAVVMYKFGR